MEPEYILNTIAEDINLGVCCALCGRPFVQWWVIRACAGIATTG